MLKKLTFAILVCLLYFCLAVPAMALDTTINGEAVDVKISGYTKSETMTLPISYGEHMGYEEITVYYVSTSTTVTIKRTGKYPDDSCGSSVFYTLNDQGVYACRYEGGETSNDGEISRYNFADIPDDVDLVKLQTTLYADVSYEIYFMLDTRALATQPVLPTSPTNTDLAYATNYKILVDGVEVAFDAYALKDANGNDTNYLKLRDVANILNGSKAQFNVTWDGAINIVTGAAYVANGSEMSTPFSGNQRYAANASPVKVNGSEASLDAITLTDASGNGYTYFKLRDLGEALGFSVNWDGANITIGTGRGNPSDVSSSKFIWPVEGDVYNGWTESLIFNETMGDMRPHLGIDIEGALGTDVVAVAAGTVETVTEDFLYGITVTITHEGGVKSVYSNLAEDVSVEEGEHIKAGALIGTIGDTSHIEAVGSPHLHFEMFKGGDNVDPVDYLPR